MALAMRAMATQLNGADVPFAEHARRCLGVPVAHELEALFEAAHARLDSALPAGRGSLAERLHTWQQAHVVPADRLPELAGRAVAETVARTREIVPLPEEPRIGVELAALLPADLLAGPD